MYKLEVQDLHKRYGSHEVLKGVSLAAKAGDVISIIGSSGSGKSTFLRCINLLEQPHAGKILLNNEELKLVANKDGALKASDPKQLQRMRSRLSMVFQHFNLWSHMTALENVMVGRHVRTRAGVLGAMLLNGATRAEEAAIRQRLENQPNLWLFQQAVDDLIVEVILCRQTQCVGLNPDIDVF